MRARTASRSSTPGSPTRGIPPRDPARPTPPRTPPRAAQPPTPRRSAPCHRSVASCWCRSLLRKNYKGPASPYDISHAGSLSGYRVLACLRRCIRGCVIHLEAVVGRLRAARAAAARGRAARAGRRPVGRRAVVARAERLAEPPAPPRAVIADELADRHVPSRRHIAALCARRHTDAEIARRGAGFWGGVGRAESRGCDLRVEDPGLEVGEAVRARAPRPLAPRERLVRKNLDAIARARGRAEGGGAARGDKIIARRV